MAADITRRTKKRSEIRSLITSWIEERPELDLQHFLLGIVAMRVGRILEGGHEQMCRDHFGISGTDMRVLFALRRSGKPYVLRPTDLFRALLVTSGAITKQVDRLQAKGLVERSVDPDFGSSFLIRLTRKGVKIANAATDLLAKDSLISAAMANIPKDLQQNGTSFLYRLLDELERTPPNRRLIGDTATYLDAPEVRSIVGLPPLAKDSST